MLVSTVLGVLLQRREDGKWQPVSFFSRKIRDAELNYTVTEKECLAAVEDLKKWRHYLYGAPTFTIVSDHSALKWLMNLKDPRGRLARWMIEIMDFEFVVKYAPGNRLVVPDALSRDAVGKPLCPKCREEVNLISESPHGVLTIEEIRTEQHKQYGDPEEYMDKNDDMILDEDDLLCKLDLYIARVLVPTTLQPEILKWVHGSKVHGHFGVATSAGILKQRFWWPRWKKNLREYIGNCVNCNVQNLKRPGRQGKMKMWHPLRRFQVVAVDILEISPSSKNGNNKVVVIGDLFSRLVYAKPVKDEKASTVAKVILDEWFLRYGPPERLLSDRGITFLSRVVKNLCKMVGTRKIFTSPYHPQTDGFIERFNRTIMRDIRAFFSIDMEHWDDHVALACFRYNTTVHEATKMTPYKAVYGIEAFDFDAEVGRRMMIDEEAQSNEELGKKLAELHNELLDRSTLQRVNAKKQYDKLVAGAEYEVGDRVMVYNPPMDIQKGRKLQTPWMGPYRVEEQLTSIAYIVRAEADDVVARVHVNRLRSFKDGIYETTDAQNGVFPDTRRIIKSITDEKIEDGKRMLKIRKAFSRGDDWVEAQNLPELIVAEYDAIKKAKSKS